MLLDLLLNGLNLESLLTIVLLIPALLFALSFHEYAHGLAAYSQGDHFAKNTGRLTLNPFAHLDMIGTISMLLVGFGWAKPVPVVPGNFKHGKASMLLVALAGVFANVVLAFASVLLLVILLTLTGGVVPVMGDGILYALYLFTLYFASVNITLAVFNLIPIPPLDGYKVLREFLCNYQNQDMFYKFERYGTWLLVLFLILNYNVGILSGLSSYVWNGMLSIASAIVGLFV